MSGNNGGDRLSSLSDAIGSIEARMAGLSGGVSGSGGVNEIERMKTTVSRLTDQINAQAGRMVMPGSAAQVIAPESAPAPTSPFAQTMPLGSLAAQVAERKRVLAMEAERLAEQARVEERAHAQAEAQAQAQIQAQARLDAEAQARAEQQANVRRQAEERNRQRAQAQVEAQALAQAQVEAEAEADARLAAQQSRQAPARSQSQTSRSVAPSTGTLPDNALRELVGKLDTIKADLAGMKHAVSRQTQDAAKASSSAEELHAAEFARLAASIDALGSKTTRTDDAAFDKLHDEIAALRQSMRQDLRATVKNEIGEGFAVHSKSDPAQTMMPKVEALGAQITELRDSVSDLPGTMALNRLEGQLRDMAQAVESLARVQADVVAWAPEQSHFEAEGFAQIEARLDEITRALVAVGSPTLDPEQLNIEGAVSNALSGAFGNGAFDLTGLEERMDALPGMMNGALTGAVGSAVGTLDLSGVERLEARMVDLFAHVEHLSEEAASARETEAVRMAEAGRELEELDRLGHQIAALSERLIEIERHAETSSRAAARVLSHAPDFSGVEDRMADLAAKLDDMAQADDSVQTIMALEAQVAGLSAQLNEAGFGQLDMAPLELRLAEIENMVASNQNAAVDAAHQAAQSVVAMLGDTSEQGRVVAELAGELRVMQDAFEQADHRQAQSFDAVRHTLDVVSDRLVAIETGMSGIASNVSGQADLSGTLAQAVSTMRAVQAASAAPVQPHMDPVRQPAVAAAFADTIDARGLQSPSMQAPSLDAAEMFEPAVAEPLVVAAPPSDLADQDALIAPGGGMPDLEAVVARASQRLASGASEAALDPGIEDTLDPTHDLLDNGGDLSAIYADPAGTHSAPNAHQSDVVAAARRAVLATRAELDAVETERSQLNGDNGSGALASLTSRLPKLGRKSMLLAAVLVALAASGYYATSKIGAMIDGGASRTAAVEVPASTTARIASEPASDVLTSAPVIDAQETALSDTAPLEAATTDEARSFVPNAEPSGAAALPQITEPANEDGEIASAPAEEGVETSTFTVPVEPAEAAANQPAPVVAAAGPIDGTVTEPVNARDAKPAAVDVPAGIAPQALRDAARGGNRTALYEIGVRYSQGRGVKRDMALAAEWFGRSAERGYAPGEYSLGSLHEKGVGVPQDFAKAGDLYESAAAKGNARAMHNLAVLNAQDTPDRKADFETALKWWNEAASLGVKDSQFNLGILHARGMGVPQDLVQSYKWFAVAARDGDADAVSKRDDVAAMLKGVDLERAKTLAKAFSEQTPITSANVVEIPAEWNDRPVESAKVDRAAVKQVQTLLNRAGYSVGKPDGLAGPRTTRAIVEFQRSWSLPVSGRIDAALMTALKDAAA